MATNQVHLSQAVGQRYEKDEKRAMDPNDDCSYQVELFVYDLTRGLARTLSPALLGKQIDGIWHTGVVAYGREYFFGSAGVESCKPGGTILGEPDRIEALGESQVPYQLFLEYIFGLGESAYRPGAYDLLKHNCNNFSDDISQFLCGRGVPKAILQLPEEVLNTPLGSTLNDTLKKVELKHANSRSINFGPLSNTLGPTIQLVRTSYDDPEFDELNDAIDQVRHHSVVLEEKRNSLNDKISKKERKERRKEKRERKENRRKERTETSEERRQRKKKSKPPLPPSDTFALESGERRSRDRSRQRRHSYASESSDTVGRFRPDTSPNFDSELNTTVETVSNLRLSDGGSAEKEVTTTWEPVDDFWGNQKEDSPSGPTTDASTIEESIDPPAAYADRLDNNPHQGGATVFQTDYNDTGADMENGASENTGELQAPPLSPSADSGAESPPEVEREPPILFKEDVDVRRDFEELAGCVMQQLAAEEQEYLEQLRVYVVEDDGAWSLGESFSNLFSRIFQDPNIPDKARYHLLRILAVAALKDDVILLLHQDRKDHTIMNFVNNIEHLSPDLQEAIALFFCNMFEHLSPSEWLLYISEWNPEGSMPISNIRVTTKVAVNALLHSNNKVQNYGTAIMYNLGTKEVKTVVFDDVAPELAMAILQFFNTKPKEELLWRTITALCRFCYASSEVPSLIKMIGPEPNNFKGLSERIDAVIEEINAKLSRVRLF